LPELQHEHRYKPPQGHGSLRKGGQHHTSLERPERTWADAARASSRNNKLTIMHPTFHTVAKDLGLPYAFATISLLFITCTYSSNTENLNELVFKHVYPAGKAATRELLHSYSIEAHAAIYKRLGINLFCTDVMRYTLTDVTSKKESSTDSGFQRETSGSDSLVRERPN